MIDCWFCDRPNCWHDQYGTDWTPGGHPGAYMITSRDIMEYELGGPEPLPDQFSSLTVTPIVGELLPSPRTVLNRYRRVEQKRRWVPV